MDDKEKALEEENTIEKTLSSRVIVVYDNLEKESYKEQLEALKRKCDGVIDEGIKGVFEVFQDTYDQVEVLFLEYIFFERR